MPSTTYLSFTSEGGRIGRVAWSNGDEKTWGDVHWDRWWPHVKPTPTQLQELIAQIRHTAQQLAEALMPTIQRATEAISQLGEAFARLQ